ncbi:SPARC related modular calcium binding-like protein magu isoform X2 [Oratosquilla oratoria]|uniref:SPARC related modular calcium binding-like protein magu isoform X2 n=1 Tax=Oratosquilla oratoria TaxID=337810 RepID=UPI003F762D40
MQIYRGEVSGVAVVMRVVLTVMVLTAATCLGEKEAPDAQAPLSCPAKCRRNKSRSMCGSNGRTYDSNCALLRARCKDPTIQLKHEGPCAETGRCLHKRRIALRKARKEQGLYVPRCLKDGSFDPVQCHESTGYCFCVWSTGVAIELTAVKNKIPNCSAVNRTPPPASKGACQGSRCGHMGNGGGGPGNDYSGEDGGFNRRGPGGGGGRGDAIEGGGKLDPPLSLQLLSTVKPPTPSHSRGTELPTWNHFKKRLKSECQGRRLKKFVKGIVQDFKKEFRRASESRKKKGETLQVPRSKRSSRAIMYKFKLLDKDSNNFLTKSEYQKLRSIVRKKLKPKRCARSFPLMCDMNRDNTISDQEWISCLDTSGSSQPNSSHSYDQGAVPSCLRERDAILKMATESSNTTYLPNCTENGLFVRKQCFGSAQKNLWFCWCVDEFNGKSLHGSSIEGNCTQRPWKGCPREKQHDFLQDLQRFFNSSLTPDGLTGVKSGSAEKGEASETRQQTGSWKRRVATHYFSSFDKNSNGVLERRELKKLRKFVLKEKELKKCGRRLINFCDNDDDGKVTKLEWTNCIAPDGGLGVIATAEPSTGTHRNSSINPFIELLRSEDDEPSNGGGRGV